MVLLGGLGVGRGRMMVPRENWGAMTFGTSSEAFAGEAVAWLLFLRRVDFLHNKNQGFFTTDIERSGSFLTA